MEFSREVLERFPGLSVVEGTVRSIDNRRDIPGLVAFREEAEKRIRARFTLEEVKDDPVFRAYRDFFWSVGVDPTKVRPASEALVRRILSGKGLPEINPVVDIYNIVSAESGVPIAAFDADRLEGELSMRFARDGELFLGIGMEKPLVLRRNQLVVVDGESIVAVYPYRDSDGTKVTRETENVHIVSCGAPGVPRELVAGAFRLCAEYLEMFTGGSPPASPLVSPREV
ncbi:MAG: phenylalanine--tRNA ligase beta subunit-related protein [Methanolinea sp.]|nr:phenylalanine--tRNA ligase beta subunit-related protein [Methanolinea sp.]